MKKNNFNKNIFLPLLVSGCGLLVTCLSISNVFSKYNILPNNQVANIQISMSEFENLNNFDLTYLNTVTGKVKINKGETVYIDYKIMQGDINANINGNDTYVTNLSIDISSNNTNYLSYISGINTINYASNSYFSSQGRNQMEAVLSGQILNANSNFPIAIDGLNSKFAITLSNSSPIESIILDLTFKSEESNDYYSYAYVVGSMNDENYNNVNWTETEYYKMTPDIASSTFLWKWMPRQDLGMNTFPTECEFKCKNGNNYSGGSNHRLHSGYRPNIKAITWDGNVTSGLNVIS